MVMTQPDKYYLEAEKAFASADDKKIAHKLNEIRKTGKPNIIPLVASLLEKHDGDGIEKIVLEILSQLKDKECVPYVIESVKKKNSDLIKKKLIMTCWQSGLDYSEYIVIFAQEFLKGSYETAIEAFTVIEEWIHNTSKEQIIACKTFLNENINKVKEDKKDFYLELVKFVERYI